MIYTVALLWSSLAGKPLFKGSYSVEQLIRNEKVGGSIPLSGTN